MVQIPTVVMRRQSDGAMAVVNVTDIEKWRAYGLEPEGSAPVIDPIDVDEPHDSTPAPVVAKRGPGRPRKIESAAAEQG